VVIVAVAVLAAVVWCGTDAAGRCRGRHWVGVWATSPSDGRGESFADQTLRLVVNPTRGGAHLRVRLSNRYGAAPVTFGGASIGLRASGADLRPGTIRALRFRHGRSVTIAPGREAVSDQVGFAFDAFQDVVVSLHVKGASGPSTEHLTAFQRSYVSAPGSGDQTRVAVATPFTRTLTTWPFLTDVEVRASRRIGAVVAVGDSITDGVGSPIDQNRRYPDVLARRLAVAGLPLAVQNEGIGGNQVLRDGTAHMFAPSLLDRLDRDVLDQTGASVVILMEGTNDFFGPSPASAAEVIDGLRTAAARMRGVGLRVILGTLPPCEIFGIAARNAINDWILTSGAADGVVDFHAALADPDDQDRLRPEFDSGDHLHPNAAGYAAMAGVVDLNLLANDRCP
jgi:lysophospholipase L1-like esterase